jgi:protein SCO1/2
MKHFFIFLLAAVALSTSCQPPPAKHYPVQAEVIAVDAPKKLITVKHGDIPGLMPAMTMQYMVAEPKQIATLRPGDKITADLVVSEGRGQLEQIVLVSKADAKP